MKLIRFSVGEGAIRFGVVIGEHAVAFETLQARSGQAHSCLRDSHGYLCALPQSEQIARELADWGSAHLAELADVERPALSAVRLHAPVEVSALYDFGLTPRHLANSIATMGKYEKDNPQTSALLEAMKKMLFGPRPAAAPGQPERLSYYKSNMNSVVGSGEIVPWPVYTSYLDVEPELGVIYGNPKQPVAGYCIFNDVSARDVQAAEIVGGFCLSKDMAKGNQLGPYLVTADEVETPFDLAVTVTVDGIERFRGSTSEISHRPQDMVQWLNLICPLSPGSVMGMGTIPDCTGMDIDDFLDPGAVIAISIERLGTLHCKFAEPAGKLLPSRWPVRDALKRYHA
jgi:2-keto-4-pentenoate hydratase/2-oxohepta-3-ene-1,7-dioic acid hydratase in catechol pathway